MKIRKKVEEINNKCMDYINEHPTSSKVVGAIAIGVISVGVGYLVGCKRRRKNVR